MTVEMRELHWNPETETYEERPVDVREVAVKASGASEGSKIGGSEDERK